MQTIIILPGKHHVSGPALLLVCIRLRIITGTVKTPLRLLPSTDCLLFLPDVNLWLNSCRLRLNPSKTQVMWLGSGQQLQQIDITDVPMLATTVKPSETSQDLRFMIDRQISLVTHISWFPHSSAPSTTNCGSCFQLLNRCQMTHPMRWSRHSYRLDWTIAIRWCKASLTVYFKVAANSKRICTADQSSGRRDRITQRYVKCIGYR
jgi:hypothetical protein